MATPSKQNQDTSVKQEQDALLEALSLYEQHCGARGGAEVMRKLRALQFALVQSDEQRQRPACAA